MYLVPVSACQRSILLIFCCWLSISLSAQTPDSTLSKISNLPSRLFDRIEKKTASLNQQLNDQTQKYIRRMIRQEDRLRNRLSKMDSAGAAQLFANTGQRYGALAGRLQQDSGRKSMVIQGVYRPWTDSLQMVAGFMQEHASQPSVGGELQNVNGQVQNLTSGVTGKLQGATSQLQALQAKFQDANILQQYMQQRQAQIQQYLSRYSNLPSSITNSFSQYKAQVYYYKQQVEIYRDILNDPDKMLQTALAVLDKVPAFSNFVKSHSMLSGIVPGGSAPPVTSAPEKPGQGLPGRDQVLASLQEQMGKNGPSAEALAKKAMSSATESASGGSGSSSGGSMGSLGSIGSLASLGSVTSLSGLAARLPGSGGGGGTTVDPGFKPNSEKGKSFGNRLEFGVNLQNTPSTYFFPTTTDLGVSLGYKLNDNNRVGVGASYKVGWAGDIHHIQVSSQGASLRSFLDVQIKRSWFVSGGLELNYQQPIYNIHLLRNLDNWQPSGLIGFSKIISMKTKVFKNTKLQFLWDFLAYYQVPVAQPLVFRVGYSF
jgi:hypothetical protein